jgi:hypothetical protein
LLAAACGLVVASCTQTPARVELQGRVDATTATSAVEVRVIVPQEHAHDGARYLGTALAAVKRCQSYFGAFGLERLTLVDAGWQQAPPRDTSNDSVVLERVRWWATTTSMAPELAAARGTVRRCWTTAVDVSALPPWFTDGIVEFTARRVVAPSFESDNNPPGYAFLETRHFGGFVPRFVRIRLPAETDVDATTSTGRAVLALGTLERWLGRPVFDQILAQFVTASRGHAPHLDEFERLASSASGQRLSWFFDVAFRSENQFDYGVDRFDSVRDPDGSFVTTVVARRYGEAQFTGTQTPPVGDFESGRGVLLLVTFEDGQHWTDVWDGRNRQKTFRYRSPGRAASVILDPQRVLLLDMKQTNNSKTLTPQSRNAATRWAGRWMAWLEHALLNYAVFV